MEYLQEDIDLATLKKFLSKDDPLCMFFRFPQCISLSKKNPRVQKPCCDFFKNEHLECKVQKLNNLQNMETDGQIYEP